ncbi:hypothetical protein BGZ73_001354, partial [Actinomortierella ambigua]
MFGQSAQHYCEHFRCLLSSLPYRTLEEWDASFQGITLDYSQAQYTGLEMAIRQHYRVDESVDIKLEKHLRFCEVHFQRSLLRVLNTKAVHWKRRGDFRRIVEELISTNDELLFKKLVARFHKQFRDASAWLRWYLCPSRARFQFAAVRGPHDISHLEASTNAQEIVGRYFKQVLEHKYQALYKVIQSTHLYISELDSEIHGVASGLFPRYGQRGKKQNSHPTGSKEQATTDQANNTEPVHLQGYGMSNKPQREKVINDGRAPDSNTRLFSRSSQKHRRERNDSDAGCYEVVDDDISESIGTHSQIGSSASNSGKTLGVRPLILPWGFEIGDTTYTNTCPMDVSLFIVYMLWKHADLQVLTKSKASRGSRCLMRVLDILDQAMTRVTNDVDLQGEARAIWATEILGGRSDFFDSIEDIFLDHLHDLYDGEGKFMPLCDHSDCSRRARGATFKFGTIALKHGRGRSRISSDKIVSSLVPGAPCKLPSFKGTKHKESAKICPGQLSHELKAMITTPQLIIIDCGQDICWQRASNVVADRYVRLEEERFILGAAIFLGRGHFT